LVSLIESAVRVQQQEEEELEAERMARGNINQNDFVTMNRQIHKMGGVKKLISSLPGGDKALGTGQVDEGVLDNMEVIINSMTKAERENPGILNSSRRIRIANGAGVTVTDVNNLLKRFNETKKMVKKLSVNLEQRASSKNKKGKKNKRRRNPAMPGLEGIKMSDLKNIQKMLDQ
jgi:signal recognition particle subunit SRP54